MLDYSTVLFIDDAHSLLHATTNRDAFGCNGLSGSARQWSENSFRIYTVDDNKNSNKKTIVAVTEHHLWFPVSGQGLKSDSV